MSAQKSNCPQSQTPNSELSSQYNVGPLQAKQLNEQTSVQAQFQKNYPKNIFIPLIEYLTEIGYKQAYQKCVGQRAQFEGKNVVSLSSIYTLITQDWFCRNINKEGSLAHISNKILINSKIKKKLFHILIANMILMTQFDDVKDFKRRVSKQANLIAKKSLPQDDLFSYPNAIIYLLYIFLKILMPHANKKGYLKLQEQLEKLSLEQAPAAQAKTKNTGSKQQYKFYVKEVVHVMNGKGLQIYSLTDILQEIKQSILEKDKNLREKYQLIEGIPNWICFIEIVVVKCFQYKRKDMKITNFLLNEWINECKTKMLCVFKTEPQTVKVCLSAQNYWQTGSIDWKHNKFNFSSEQKEQPEDKSKEVVITAGKSKIFKPIIISIEKMN